jgi:ubiquinol-cytochrome c reductase subunit 6
MPSFPLPHYSPTIHPEPAFVKEMLEQGKDPKDKLIAECTPKCEYWKDKLERCEMKLEQVLKLNPSKSCLYPMRDYITCIDACVNPMIFHHLRKSG